MTETTDTYTGKPFRWNGTVIVDGMIVPARGTVRTFTYLHPTRVPDALLRELNRPASRQELRPGSSRAAFQAVSVSDRKDH